MDLARTILVLFVCFTSPKNPVMLDRRDSPGRTGSSLENRQERWGDMMQGKEVRHNKGQFGSRFLASRTWDLFGCNSEMNSLHALFFLSHVTQFEIWRFKRMSLVGLAWVTNPLCSGGGRPQLLALSVLLAREKSNSSFRRSSCWERQKLN